jgi:hypothetical protein
LRLQQRLSADLQSFCWFVCSLLGAVNARVRPVTRHRRQPSVVL